MYHHNKRLTPYAKQLRKNMTYEESKLWYNFLRTYNVRFLRQKVIENYIVDFYCAKASLIVEIDGASIMKIMLWKKTACLIKYWKVLGIRF